MGQRSQSVSEWVSDSRALIIRLCLLTITGVGRSRTWSKSCCTTYQIKWKSTIDKKNNLNKMNLKSNLKRQTSAKNILTMIRTNIHLHIENVTFSPLALLELLDICIVMRFWPVINFWFFFPVGQYNHSVMYENNIELTAMGLTSSRRCIKSSSRARADARRGTGVAGQAGGRCTRLGSRTARCSNSTHWKEETSCVISNRGTWEGECNRGRTTRYSTHW